MAKKINSKKVSTKTNGVAFTPLGDRVLVRPLTAEERGVTTASGIIIPESAQEKATEGEVVAVGPGKYENGALIPMTVSIGDRVMYSKYGHEEVKFGGVEYAIVTESNILGITQ